jgi:hypothetical protein
MTTRAMRPSLGLRANMETLELRSGRAKPPLPATISDDRQFCGGAARLEAVPTLIKNWASRLGKYCYRRRLISLVFAKVRSGLVRTISAI